MVKNYIIIILVLLTSIVNINAQSCADPNTVFNVQITYITDSSTEGTIDLESSSPDGYLVVRRLSADNNFSLWPSSNSTYSADEIVLGGEVVSFGNSLIFSDSGLSKLTTYYYFIYPYNNCGDGTYAYDTNVAAYPIQTKNDPCITEDFEGVSFINGNASKFCDYDEAPEDWIISKKACIEDNGGNEGPNHAVMNGASDYVISPLVLNPSVVEFWAKADVDPNEIAWITVQYSTTGLSWESLSFFSAEADTSNGDITNEWAKYVIDFSLLNENSGLEDGDYYIKWIFNGNPFPFYLDDIKIYCSGSTINCPPQTTWTKTDLNDESTLNWWETDEEGNLLVPYTINIPTVNISATIDEDYDTSTNGDFETCSLTISSGATLNINTSENNSSEHHYVAIVKQLEVNGTLLVQNSNSLIMVNNGGEVINNGVTNIIRKATPTKNYDYTYWSSPVKDASFSSFVGSYQGYIFKYVTENFKDLYDNNLGGGTSGNSDGLDDDEPYLDPGTWQQWNPNYDWQKPTETSLTPGEGYIVIAPSGGSLTGQEVTFSGAVNNGVIKNDLYLSSNLQSQDTLVYPYDFDDWNLIGNPYPSAIDAAAFLGNPANIDLIGGTAYLWTHVKEISDTNTGYGGYENYASGDYAYFNRSGQVLVESNQNQNLSGKIASGQSFMVEVNTTGEAGTKIGEVTFINSMRYSTKESDYNVYPSHDNSEFYKPSNSKKKRAGKAVTSEDKDRIWLNLTENAGAFSQMLVGFFEYNQSDLEHATNGIDRAFDGKRLISGNYVDIYSVINDIPFAIQGRSSLKNDDVIPIGYVSNITGTLKISIGKIEGALADTEVYLEDKLLHKNGEYHKLSDADYEFTVEEAGTVNDRFNLRFSRVEEEVEPSELLTEEVIVSNYNDAIYLRSLKGLKMKQIMVYDLLGREIVNTPFNNTGFILRSSNIKKGSLFIFKVLLENEKMHTKRIIKL